MKWRRLSDGSVGDVAITVSVGAVAPSIYPQPVSANYWTDTPVASVAPLGMGLTGAVISFSADLTAASGSTAAMDSSIMIRASRRIEFCFIAIFFLTDFIVDFFRIMSIIRARGNVQGGSLNATITPPYWLYGGVTYLLRSLLETAISSPIAVKTIIITSKLDI